MIQIFTNNRLKKQITKSGSNLKTNIEYQQYLYSIKLYMDDQYQIIFKFLNDYGVSIIKGPNSYGGSEGLYEIGILKFRDDLPYKYEIIETSLIEGDTVRGYLTKEECIKYIYKVMEL